MFIFFIRLWFFCANLCLACVPLRNIGLGLREKSKNRREILSISGEHYLGFGISEYFSLTHVSGARTFVPQWLDMGPPYSADENGDGPHSSGEYIGIQNLGNTCFFNAASQFLISIVPIQNAVENLAHNIICKKNCFVCIWEKFARQLLHKDDPDPLPALTQLAAETNYELYEEADAAAVIERVIGKYSLLELEATFEETRLCLGCDKRQVDPPTPIIVKTSIANFVLTRDVSNLFSDESTVNDEFACNHCNDVLGLDCNDQNNCVTLPQIQQRTLINTSDWVVFKVGRSIGAEQRATWAVSVEETIFRGKSYQPIAWVEHLRTFATNHYITYRRICGRTFLFDDSQVNLQANDLLNNTNVVLVVMRRTDSVIPHDVALDASMSFGLMLYQKDEARDSIDGRKNRKRPSQFTKLTERDSRPKKLRRRSSKSVIPKSRRKKSLKRVANLDGDWNPDEEVKTRKRKIKRKSDRKRRNKKTQDQRLRRVTTPVLLRKTNAARKKDPVKLGRTNAARNKDPVKMGRTNAVRNIDPVKLGRTNVARKRKQKLGDVNFDIWNANELPGDNHIKKFESNASIAVATFRMLSGVPSDTRYCPQDVTFTYDRQRMIDRWSNEAGHDIPIRVCGVCGIRDILVQDTFRQLPLDHDLIKVCVLTEEIKSKVHREALHIVEKDGIMYILAPEGFSVNTGLVNVCADCITGLQYSMRTRKPPKYTIAYYDIGKIPLYIPKLTLLERFAISRVIVFTPIVELKIIHGARSTSLNGHVVALPTNAYESVQSFVSSLPRRDLSRRVKVTLQGKRSTWKVAKALARKGPLSIKIEPVLILLGWLKELGSPVVQDCKIPSTKQEISEVEAAIEQAVKEILHAAACTSSALVHELSEHVRTTIDDKKDGADENDGKSFLRNVLLTESTKPIEPMTSALHTILQQLNTATEEEDNSSLPIVIDESLVNEYEANHKLLSYAFPWIFPLGLPKEVMGTATVPTKLAKKWLLFYDRRCSREIRLLWLLFDQKRRHAANLGASIRIKTKGNRAMAFTKLTSSEGFRGQLEKAIKNPNTSESRQLKQVVGPLIKIGAKVPWRPIERSSMISRFYALAQFFNAPCFFITISPAMRNTPLALRMTFVNNGEQFSMPAAHLRSKMIADNPIAAARVFYHIMQKMCDIIIGLPIKNCTGRRLDVSHLLKVNKGKFIGAYGKVTAYEWRIEQQTGGALHAHGNLYGCWDIDVIQRWIHLKSFRNKVVDLIDSIITCRIPEEIKQEPKQSPCPVFAAEPYPRVEDVKTDAARINRYLNHHNHSFTCWKYHSCPHCRAAYKRQLAPETYYAEVHADPASKDKIIPIRKHADSKPGHEVISPPPP